MSTILSDIAMYREFFDKECKFIIVNINLKTGENKTFFILQCSHYFSKNKRGQSEHFFFDIAMFNCSFCQPVKFELTFAIPRCAASVKISHTSGEYLFHTDLS